jgi:uncharacterized protein (UPF0332 family)
MTYDPKLVARQKVDFAQINKILKKAYIGIKSAKQVRESDSKFELSYGAMLKTAQALMRSYGLRTKAERGHHLILVDFAKNKLGLKFTKLTATYNQMRKKRNKLEYDIDSVSISEAKSAVAVAEKFYSAVEQKISQDNPQQKLWRP